MPKTYKIQSKKQAQATPEQAEATPITRLKIDYVPIDSLIPALYNPREANEAQIQQLTASIKKKGLIDPILVNTFPGRENIIIGGHFRVRIAKGLGYTEVPVIFLKLDEGEEREFNIRLNKNTGSFSNELLAANFQTTELIEWGFLPKELDVPSFKELEGYTQGNAPEEFGMTKYELVFETPALHDEFLQFMQALKKHYDVPATEALLKFLREYMETKPNEA